MQSGERVYLGSGRAVPDALVDALTARAAESTGGRSCRCWPSVRRRTPRGSWRITSAATPCSSVRTCARRSTRAAPTTCRSICTRRRPCCATAACRLDQTPSWWSPPDEHGLCSFGIEVGVTSRPPWARGGSWPGGPAPAAHPGGQLHPRLEDRCLRGGRSCARLRPAEPSPTEKRIGEHVAGLVEDGTCPSRRIGGIRGAVLDFLDGGAIWAVHPRCSATGCSA